MDDWKPDKPEDLRGLPYLGREPNEVLESGGEIRRALYGDLLDVLAEERGKGLEDSSGFARIFLKEYEVTDDGYQANYYRPDENHLVVATVTPQGVIHLTALDAHSGAFVVEGEWRGIGVTGQRGRALYLVPGLYAAQAVGWGLFWRFVGQHRLEKAHSPIWSHLNPFFSSLTRQAPTGTTWVEEEGFDAFLLQYGEVFLNVMRDRNILRQGGAQGTPLESERIETLLETLGVFDGLARVEPVEEFLVRAEVQEELKAALGRDRRRRPRIPPTRPLRLPVDARIVARAFNILNQEGVAGMTQTPDQGRAPLGSGA